MGRSMRANSMIPVRGRKGAFAACLALLALGFLACPARAAESQLAIRDVSVDRPVIRPGESVRISFFLSHDARASLKIFSPHYEPIRTVESGRLLPAGRVFLTGDGRDDWGAQVPNEAFLYAIEAATSGGQRVIHDPTQDSGGESLDIPVSRLERAGTGYRIHFTVPSTARVDIRAGIHAGPLLSNILTWKPFSPGEYSHDWDSLDATGRIRVMDHKAGYVYIQAYRLPANTLLVTGGKDDYPAYHKGLKTRRPGTDDQAITFDAVRSAAIVRVGQGLSMPYVTGAALDAPVRFAVYGENDREVGLADKGTPTVSGQLRLVITVAPESLEAFNNGRYEIVVFVDNDRVDEEEHSQSPYHYVLDTTRMSNGEHAVTINQAGLNGQVGSYTFRINVQNG